MKDNKEVVDLMGATKKVFDNMVSFYNNAQEEAKERMISADKYWPFMMKNIKTEAKITDYSLAMAGMPVPMLMDIIGEADVPATYTKVIIKTKDGTVKEFTIEDVLPKLQPYTKQFENPMQALVYGDPDAILKVMQKVYGADVVQWSIPAQQAEAVFETLSALCLVDLHNAAKFKQEAVFFTIPVVAEDASTEDRKVSVKEEAVEKLVDAFDKSDADYVIDLFPHTDPDYPLMLVNESQTVLNTLSSEEMDKLWPNINREYLVNLKESELDTVYSKILEGCGMTSDADKKKKKKVKKANKDESSSDTRFGAPVKKGRTIRGRLGKSKATNGTSPKDSKLR